MATHTEGGEQGCPAEFREGGDWALSPLHEVVAVSVKANCGRDNMNRLSVRDTCASELVFYCQCLRVDLGLGSF